MERVEAPGYILENLSVLVYKKDPLNKVECLELLEKLKHSLDINGSRRDQYDITIIAQLVELICSSEASCLTNTCINWLGQLLSQKKIKTLPADKVKPLVSWIWYNLCSSNDLTNLNTLALVIKANPEVVPFCFEVMVDRNDMNLLNKWSYEAETLGDEDMYAIAYYLDTLLSCLVDGDINQHQHEVVEIIGNTIISLHYKLPSIDRKTIQRVLFLMFSINILNKVVAISVKFGKEHISELLGIAKMYLQFGIIPRIGPLQKICASHQAMADSADESVSLQDVENYGRNMGGKILKTRKPRSIVKASGQRQITHNNQGINLESTITLLELKTSDSEMSETEAVSNSMTAGPTRYQCARVRLASITLIALLAKAMERKFLFGYWHALFPNFTNTIGIARDDLLIVAEHDPNTRCRCIALQIASQVLLGSKDFLNQAEFNSDDCPNTYLPFTISLGLMVVSIYNSLITILRTEASLSVLILALRSLAVLIQATPFQRFENGLVRRFVEIIQSLINHNDTSVQVAALMVMEFLIARPELSAEIYDTLGKKKPLNLTSSTAKNYMDLDNTYQIQECEQIEELTVKLKSKMEINETTNGSSTDNMPKMCSWLLLFVLKNLDSGENFQKCAAVRIECLQILSAMATHFTLIDEHLEEIACVLEKALEDPLGDVRLSAGRCLDSCAYQMGRNLLESYIIEGSTKFVSCDRFWARLMPIMMKHIDSKDNELSALKVSLCDAFSNIGAVTFERLSTATKMNVFSFLSGISSDPTEEMIVRTSAVRALAVFILFPSLRGNLVFVENAAELMLRLVDNTNVLVRIKVFWSIGNVSDALLGDTERVSEDLLQRLIEAATNACNDNDKVRCNAVRTLGNLLRLYRDEHFTSNKNRKLFMRAMQMLIKCINSVGNAKVKWNSCYAIGNLMSNHAIFDAINIYNDLNWQAPMYSALCTCIVQHSNFKVRINAAAALMHIEKRSYFGNHFELCWIALLKAIDLSHNLQNFYEYNFRDNLQEQLCLTISHLLSLATLDDYPILKRHIMPNMETIQNTWLRAANRILPEKCASVISVAILLEGRVRKSDCATLEQKNAADFLVRIFSVDNDNF